MRLGQEFRVRKSCFFVPTANHVSTYVDYTSSICVCINCIRPFVEKYYAHHVGQIYRSLSRFYPTVYGWNWCIPIPLLSPIMHGLYKIFRLRHNFSPNLCSSPDFAVWKSGISKECSVDKMDVWRQMFRCFQYLRTFLVSKSSLCIIFQGNTFATSFDRHFLITIIVFRLTSGWINREL